MIYLWVLPVAQKILRQMMGLSVNNDLEMTRMEAAFVLSKNLPGESEKEPGEVQLLEHSKTKRPV